MDNSLGTQIIYYWSPNIKDHVKNEEYLEKFEIERNALSKVGNGCYYQKLLNTGNAWKTAITNESISML
ncbi:hypothetical protein RIR_e26921_A0A2N1M674_9GLOM [Rhizophagus irregularis DAOM 181602=DAOM 197198]|uniref:Uncharacterized protein n=1 Tax=Rhizophagus irregularis TaxID=588596 RepID=A0A2N1M674_9GLOM|nr:hypothetical protein RhiirC2_798600 [Rhizophagus irregularis]GET62708.1 hypothetical protein RIR_e26921_A0A2N1M674_9GLOM [Rhizophagus irregularis DAOM 181602=DAOM 197198]